LYSVHIVPVIQGWSVISSCIQPINASMPVVAQDILPDPANLIIMVTSNGKIYWPVAGTNTIGDWNSQQGYKVKVTSPSTWTFRGDPVTNTEVELTAGSFSYLPVLTNNMIPLTDVFVNPLVDIFYIYCTQTNEVYLPVLGLFTLSDLTPGFGYYLRMNNDATASFPPAACEPIDNAYSFQPLVNESPWNLVRSADVHLIAIDQSVLEGLDGVNYIGAFDQAGNCIGYATTAKSEGNVLLTVYGDDISTSVKDGAIDNEIIRLVGYNEFEQSEVELYTTWDNSLPQHDGLYQNNGISHIIGLTTSSTGIGNANFESQISIHPNPARDEITIVYPFESSIANQASVELINAVGLVAKRVMLTSEQSRIDVSSLQPGVYVLRFESDGLVSVKRLVIQ